MAPHEDASESRERAVDNLLTRIESGEGKPAYKAWIPVPILLPGEKTSTRIEPGKSLYARVEPASRRPGVIDAAIWIGYAWADEPRNHAVVMVTGDDESSVTTAAEELAQAFWDVFITEPRVIQAILEHRETALARQRAPPTREPTSVH